MAEPVDALLLGTADNVAVALRALPTGTEVLVGTELVRTTTAIPVGHKLAVRTIGDGEPVRKYDEVIGIASAAIPVGAHVHVHNVVSARLPGGDQL